MSKQLPPSPRKDDKQETPPPRSTGRRPPLASQLEEFVGSLAIMATPVDSYAGEVIAFRSRELADAWARLAQKNPTVKRVLEGMMQGGSWGEVVMVSLSVAIPIAWNRGLVRDDIAMPFVMTGPVPPSADVRAHETGGGEEEASTPPPPSPPPTPETKPPTPQSPPSPAPSAPGGAAMSLPKDDDKK